FEGTPELLFTENDTNFQRLFDVANPSPYVKDAFHEYIINGNKGAVNPDLRGTKASLHYSLEIPAYDKVTLRLRLAKTEREKKSTARENLEPGYEGILTDRIQEADEFYDSVIPASVDADTRNVLRQAYGGLLWTKQYYHFVVRQWLAGDPATPT